MLSVCLCVRHSINETVGLAVSIHTWRSACLSLYMSASQFACLSVYLSVSLSNPIRQLASQSVSSQSVYPSICLSACPSVCHPVSLRGVRSGYLSFCQWRCCCRVRLRVGCERGPWIRRRSWRAAGGLSLTSSLTESPAASSTAPCWPPCLTTGTYAQRF